MSFAIQNPETKEWCTGGWNGPQWKAHFNKYITRKTKEGAEGMLARMIGEVQEALEEKETDLKKLKGRKRVGPQTKWEIRDCYDGIRAAKKLLSKLEKCIVVETDDNAKNELYHFDFTGEKKAKWETCISGRRRCAVCGGNIFKGLGFLHSSTPMSSTNVCPFCIVANIDIAKSQINRIPAEVRKAYDEGRATEDFLDKL